MNDFKHKQVLSLPQTEESPAMALFKINAREPKLALALASKFGGNMERKLSREEVDQLRAACAKFLADTTETVEGHKPISTL